MNPSERSSLRSLKQGTSFPVENDKLGEIYKQGGDCPCCFVLVELGGGANSRCNITITGPVRFLRGVEPRGGGLVIQSTQRYGRDSSVGLGGDKG